MGAVDNLLQKPTDHHPNDSYNRINYIVQNKETKKIKKKNNNSPKATIKIC